MRQTKNYCSPWSDLKAYPLQALLGELFDLSQPRANRWIHQPLPVLQQALKDLGVRPERNPRQFAERERKQGEPLDLIIDGTERPRQRPKNKAQRDLFFSGRKRMHTDKNLVIANVKTKRIGFLSQTYAGTVPDKKMADREGIVYPSGGVLVSRHRFSRVCPAWSRNLPSEKKPCKGEFRLAEIRQNRRLKRIRVRVSIVFAAQSDPVWSKRFSATPRITFRTWRWNWRAV